MDVRSGLTRSDRRSRWVWAVVLALPASILYLAHFIAPPHGFLPTGFIQYDQLYYMANARGHFADGGFSLTYANPFSMDYGSPKIYFQPLVLLLAIVLRVTGADPGVVYCLFLAIAAVCCVRAAIALFEELFGLEDAPRKLTLLIFIWGGGLLTVAGIAHRLVTGNRNIFLFDPGGGWWFLNLGRNLIFLTEAVNHTAFLLSVLFVVRRQFRSALTMVAFVSISHPFTGIELILIMLTWSLIERLFIDDRTTPRFFVGALAVLLVFHAGYYVGFLNRFAEHRSVFEQWQIAALLQAENFLPAYALVAGLAIWSFRRAPLAAAVFAVPHNRLFLIWFLVAFALSNHEFAIRPIQPIHFTRGYNWMPLFLLGAPALIQLFRYVLGGTRLIAIPAAMSITGVFLFDNAMWFAATTVSSLRGAGITQDERALFAWLDRPENGHAVLLADPELAYLATAYTGRRGWLTHLWNTPDAARRKQELERFFATGNLPPNTSGSTFLAIEDAARPARFPRPVGRAARWVYEVGQVRVMRIDPAERTVLR